MKYAIVNLATKGVVPQFSQESLTFGNLTRVRFKKDVTVFNPAPGYEFPPQYGETDDNDDPIPDLPVEFRLYEVAVVDVGTGPVVVNTSKPVFNPAADTVTVTRTMKPAPPPPTPDEVIEQLLNTPARMAIAKFAAKKFNLTMAQLKAELKDELV